MDSVREILDSRGRKRVQTVNVEPSKTVQSDAHLTDIRNILQSFGQGGHQMLDEAALQFADITGFTDLQDAMNQAKEAEKVFMTLPAGVRRIFDHDVAVWLDTAHDQDKRDELVAAGYLEGPKSSDTGGGPQVTAESGGVAEVGEPSSGGA